MLKWAIERIEHKADGKSTPIGIVPTAADLDLSGLDVDRGRRGRGARGATPRSGAKSSR